MIGASQGATPITQTPLSAAHKAAVDEAVKRRKALNDQYEVARKNALTLQQRQEAANAKLKEAERTKRRAAAKQADDLDAKAAQMEVQGAVADRKYGLDEIKQQDNVNFKTESLKETKRHHQAQEAKNGSGGGKGGGSKSDAVWDEYARWREAYPKEVEEIRKENANVNPYTGTADKNVSKQLAEQVNARMRRKYGTSRKTSGGNKGSALRNRTTTGGSALKNR